MQQTRTYRERSRTFLRKAREEIDAGDLEQASEKGWGAAAMMLKAVADERGLPHASHALLLGIADQLEQETGNKALGELFDSASALHRNFYENKMSHDAVEWRLRRVTEFVDKVDAHLSGHLSGGSASGGSDLTVSNP